MAIQFRKEAIEALLRPESLDETIEVTTPAVWATLAAAALVVAAALIWAFAGTVTTRLQGEGVVAWSDARQSFAVAPAGGVVVEVTAAEGEALAAGAIIARLAVPPLSRRLLEAEARLAALEAATASAGADLASARGDVAAARTGLEEASVVRAPFAGILAAVLVPVGGTASAGEPVARLDENGGELLVRATIDDPRARVVAPGMDARVSLAGLPLREAGALRGRVRTVRRAAAGETGVSVEVALVHDAAGAPVWTTMPALSAPLAAGDGVTVAITVEEIRPIDLVVPSSGDR
ncbi:HlyD family efflux transporter periplasmic adaptor subunit [Pseudoxanthobacter sp. M-2]|uniref:HlyD family efflux transporter periplasmic adaptor subunit n=1 Tax=Pseudoxanthobacter sp. M-2 TaxID=3078754 RepID=UPI0038FC912C